MEDTHLNDKDGTNVCQGQSALNEDLPNFANPSADSLQNKENQKVLGETVQAANAVLKAHGLEVSSITMKSTDNATDIGTYWRGCIKYLGVEVCIER